MKQKGLTEKNMSNKHFQKTEQAILIAYYKFRDRPGAKKIVKYAGISRSTLYRHHQSIYKIPRDYEEFLLALYTRKIRNLLNKPHLSLEMLYLRTLVFIASYIKIFRVLIAEDHKEIIKRMLLRLKPKVTSSWPAKIHSDQIFDLYANEVLGLIELWCKRGTPSSELDATLNKIIYLTSTAPTHFAPITGPAPPPSHPKPS